MDAVKQVEEAAKKVYDALGAGYKEDVYEKAMAIEFRQQGMAYDIQKAVEVLYLGERVGLHYLDFIVEGDTVVELKAGGKISLGHEWQLRAYLHTLDLSQGVLVCFPSPQKREPEVKAVER